MEKTLFYMTQYATYQSNEGYYESMQEVVAKLDLERLDYLINSLAVDVSNKYNQMLFALLYHIEDNEQLERLITLWEYLASNELEEFIESLGIDYTNWDETVYDSDTLEEMADMDLRENGIRASSLAWYDEILSGEIHVFNDYENGFYYYNSMDDYIEEYLPTYVDNSDLKDFILEYVKGEQNYEVSKYD